MEAVFKATPSGPMKWGGIAISAFMLGMGGLMFRVGITMRGEQGGTYGVMIGASLICFLFFLGLMLFLPRNYRLTDTAIVVGRWGPKVVIPLVEIRELRRVHLTKVLRTGGVGGFFGCWGQFYTDDKSHGFGNFTAYITRNDTEVAVYRKKGEVVLLSPDHPEEFMQSILNTMSPSAGG